MVVIGILALQGDFAEHRQKIVALGAKTIDIRQAKDLQAPLDGMILPGGESTVQGKLLRDLGMLEPLKSKIDAGLPVLATCAGLILLSQQIEDQESTHLETLPVTVKRNA